MDWWRLCRMHGKKVVQAPKWEEIRALHQENGELVDKSILLDQRILHDRFPNNPQAAAVKEKELALLKVTVQLGNAKVLLQLRELERVEADKLAKTFMAFVHIVCAFVGFEKS